MVIEESVLIRATLQKVWETFADITCWNDWNNVLRNVSPGRPKVLSEGSRLRFCIHPFHFPVHLEPVVEEVVPEKRLVWYSRKFGVSARHAFVFEKTADGVKVTSRETFSGLPLGAFRPLFPTGRLRELTVTFLKELKGAAEA